MDLGTAIEHAESKDGKLTLNVARGSKTIEVNVPLERLGAFSPTFPVNCKKSKLLRERALKYLAENKDAHGGASHTRMAVALALLTSDDPAQQALGVEPDQALGQGPAEFRHLDVGPVPPDDRALRVLPDQPRCIRASDDQDCRRSDPESPVPPATSCAGH